jgi:2-polyprenyl-3-methyl-5-hydroxy-6-metoxy-1,4-benzoquinol methylase
MGATAQLPEKEVIRTALRPKCILCGSQGRPLYAGLSDRLFGAPGAWDLKRCPNDQCSLIWLDPMPLTEDLGKAYARYYTHSARNGTDRPNPVKQAYRLMKRGYWLGRYRYPGSWPVKLFGKIMYLFPVRRNDMDSEARYLDALPGGRVLDVGCGAGEWLLKMRELGWQVEGVDFDENAVKAAARSGLEIGIGSVEDQNYPDERFDAITLNHVIEHVPDPMRTLTECHRILKKGGKLVLFTPNGASLSHKLFKRHWRGLEAPRHLHIFSNQSLPGLLKRVGFTSVSLRPQIARSVIRESLLIRQEDAGVATGGRVSAASGPIASVFNLAEVAALNWDSAAADCVGAIATKSE